MSLCDACPKPGTCCKRLILSTRDGPLTTWAGGALEQMADFGLPFQPLEKVGEWTVDDRADPLHGRTYVQWFWSCPKVTPEGRCSIYDRRPQLCRDYRPAQDLLCAFGSYGVSEPLPTEV